MEEKKSFFDNLDPKSALIAGLIFGVLLIGTIGFVVMLVTNYSGKAGANVQAKVDDTAAVANNQQDATPPATAVTKTDRPKAELFVMSYCPYGLQMEKAFLPAWELLKNKADFSIKFVSYAMHGLKELEENTRQYCLAKNFSAKFIPYLKCFTGKDDYKACLTEAGVSESSLASCVNDTNKKFGILDKYNDQSTWLSGRFPQYPVNADLNQTYGVQGSPTLILNGVEVSSARTPEAVKQLICSGFVSPPAECSQTLSAAAVGPGFGNTAAASGGANAGCGT
ncbi:MAG: hypothetical protein AAB678_00395 [Patescibacteria group bacterium]